ncbi:hypothetical protein ACIBUR_28580 [Streptomyces anulatus]
MPSGSVREISYRLADDGTAVYCGYTVERFAVKSAFTEAGPQILRDVRAGFPYSALASNGSRHDVAVDADGLLMAGGIALENYPFALPHRHPLPQTWLAWWRLALEDPFWYRRQRRSEGRTLDR